MNAEAFFAEARKQFGRLSQSQVDGINAILNAAGGRKRSHVAYLLATAWHETARTMQPVRETLAGSDAQAVARLDRAQDACGQHGRQVRPCRVQRIGHFSYPASVRPRRSWRRLA